VSSSIPLRRTAAIALVLFVLILAFLAGRVYGGADPAQVAGAAATVRSAAPETSLGDDAVPYGEAPYGEDSSEIVPGVPPQGDPGTMPSPGGRQLDPPMTHAS
jgi:hypothetical protein